MVEAISVLLRLEISLQDLKEPHNSVGWDTGVDTGQGGKWDFLDCDELLSKQISKLLERDLFIRMHINYFVEFFGF